MTTLHHVPASQSLSRKAARSPPKARSHTPGIGACVQAGHIGYRMSLWCKKLTSALCEAASSELVKDPGFSPTLSKPRPKRVSPGGKLR